MPALLRRPPDPVAGLLSETEPLDVDEQQLVIESLEHQQAGLLLSVQFCFGSLSK